MTRDWCLGTKCSAAEITISEYMGDFILPGLCIVDIVDLLTEDRGET